jgi:hypothetical protein
LNIALLSGALEFFLEMLELNAEKFYQASIQLKELEEFAAQETKSGNGHDEIELSRLRLLESSLYQFGLAALNLNAKFTEKEVERVRKRFKHRILENENPANYTDRPQQKVTLVDVQAALSLIRGRFMDEIGDTKVLVLESEKAHLFAPSGPLFGADFQSKFPSSAFELDEGRSVTP